MASSGALSLRAWLQPQLHPLVRGGRPDACGFVVDFSSLRPFEERLRQQFDHTFLVNRDDPLLGEWQRLHDQGALDLRVMENVGMEATAALVWDWANALLQERDGGRTCCWAVKPAKTPATQQRSRGCPTGFQLRTSCSDSTLTFKV